MTTTPTTIDDLRAALSPASWAKRVEAAEALARRCEDALRQIRDGVKKNAALKVSFPDNATDVARGWLARFEAEGVEGLIDRRLPRRPDQVVTPEVMQMIRGMLAMNPDLRAPEIGAALARAGFEVGASTLRQHLHAQHLSHPVGRPPGKARAASATPLPCAGAELLKAVEAQLGAVRSLSAAFERHMEALPAPSGEVLDDTENRDAKGRFLPSYNAPKPRTEPEVGGKFDTVGRRRAEKDLRKMRAATTSFKARYRKDLAFVTMPVLVRGARWTELGHWEGDHLGTLVGFPYQPATLDKAARELKLGGAAEAGREEVARFWLGVEGPYKDEVTGAVVVYGDVTTKPLWTHSFMRCAKVGKLGGRIMPATSTFFLHSGAGTPLVFREVSGNASVPREAISLLEEYEEAAGEGTAQRLVVLDRESHAVHLFKELDAGGWNYVIPLRQQVVGENARFEELTEWSPYEESGDEVQGGFLTLKDSRKGEDALRVRVIGRKRHRTGKVAWYATNAKEDFGEADLIRLYFRRWPAQEHVFRDANGAVGLDHHHGYGRKKVENVAVISRLEKLDARLSKLEGEKKNAADELERVDAALAIWREGVTSLRDDVGELGAVTDTDVALHATDTPQFALRYDALRTLQRWLPEALQERDRLDAARDAAQRKLSSIEEAIARATLERETLARRTRILTVDTELDEIMTAYKITFVNLSAYLMREYLGAHMELETLIQSVLTLPGERVRTPGTETIRIYRQPRDAKTMEMVERACGLLSARGLVRDERTLRFELVDRPASR